jgi:hypothetical protein
MATTEFERGREYESKNHLRWEHTFFGWATLVMAPIFYFISVWDFNTKVNTWAGLTIFGCMALLLAYSEKKELKNG